MPKAVLTLTAAWAALRRDGIRRQRYQRLEEPSAKGVLCWSAVDPGHPVGGPGPAARGWAQAVRRLLRQACPHRRSALHAAPAPCTVTMC
jgi:hypothetical protein